MLKRPAALTMLLRGATLVVATLVVATLALAQRDFADVEIETTHVAGNVYMLKGAGGNIGVSVGEDGLLLIDDQFAPLSDKIRAALQKLAPGKVSYVLNTHWHGDHTGGNAEFSGDGASVIAHDNVRRRMSAPQTIRGAERPAAEPEKLPVVTFNDQLSVHWNGEDIRAVHFPHSHTDGDSVIFFPESNVVHMGDLMFSGRFPFVDIDSGGDVIGLSESIHRVMAQLPLDAKIIPGHGPLSSWEDLRRYADMLVRTTDIVRTRIAEGKTLEQIQQEGLAEEWTEWGTGFINTETWLGTIHRSLQGD